MTKTLNQQFLSIASQFCDEKEALNLKHELSQKLVFAPIEDLFTRQSTLDRAKKMFRKREVEAMKALYFMQFYAENMQFNWESLAHDLSDYKRSFERHLGKDWVFFISSLLSLAKEMSQKEIKSDLKPRGLLLAN